MDALANSKLSNKSANLTWIHEWTTHEVIFVSMEIVFGLLTFLVNGLVLVIFWRYKSLRTLNNYFIFNLAIADIFVALFSVPLTILSQYGLPRNFYACVFTNSLVGVFVICSVCSLVGVAIDRYMAVLHPLIRVKYLTRLRILFILASFWIFSIVLGLIPLVALHRHPEKFIYCSYREVIDLQYSVYVQFFGFLIPTLLLMLFIHLRIFFAFRTSNLEWSKKSARRMSARRVWKVKEMSLFKNLSVIFLLFGICWIPLYVINSVLFWAPGVYISNDVILFTVLLTHLHSFINPLLYAIHHPELTRLKRKMTPAAPTATDYMVTERPSSTNAAKSVAFRTANPEVVSVTFMELKITHSEDQIKESDHKDIEISPGDVSVIYMELNIQQKTDQNKENDIKDKEHEIHVTFPQASPKYASVTRTKPNMQHTKDKNKKIEHREDESKESEHRKDQTKKSDIKGNENEITDKFPQASPRDFSVTHPESKIEPREDQKKEKINTEKIKIKKLA